MSNKIPELSLLNQQGAAFDYADSYAAHLEYEDIAIEKVARAFFTSAPTWVDRLFALRNNIVKVFGLKGSNADDRQKIFDDFKCNIGDQFGLFKVFAKNDQEVILGENDRHLDFRVSLFLDRPRKKIFVSTVVKFNNWSGKLYFLPVHPFHKMIVPVMLGGIVKQLHKEK